MRKIDDIYTGDYARTYDADRLASIEWTREEQAIAPMLQAIKAGETVLDLAAGTGRWLPVYAAIGAKPILLDVSRDMLEQAKAKAHGLGLEVSAFAQSAVEGPAFPHAKWAVVTRFFNWIPLACVKVVLQRCLEAKVENFLFMVTYLPDSVRFPMSMRTRFTTLRRNISSKLGQREKGIYFLHSENKLRRVLNELGLTVEVERVISDRRGRRNVMIRASTRAPSAAFPTVTVLNECHLEGRGIRLGGQYYPTKKGCWAFYIPALQLKLLHARGDRVHCIHRSAPGNNTVPSTTSQVPRGSDYSKQQWANALSKSPIRRAIENFISARRLADAELGPQPIGLCVVLKFKADYSATPTQTAGIFIEDVRYYPIKSNATESDVVAAGVDPDGSLSCVREQLRGYVIDLNSVVGVMPTDAEALITDMENYVRDAIGLPAQDFRGSSR